jgi:transcriptional regulator PpsR
LNKTDPKSDSIRRDEKRAIPHESTVTRQLSIGSLDVESAARLIAVAADISLVVDKQGVIQSVTCGSDELTETGYAGWVGRPWEDTVSSGTRHKILGLMTEAAESGRAKWRQVNLVSAGGGLEVPILYAAFRADDEGNVIAFGRDLRATAALQQRLVDAQQSMERDYWRLRYAETRYRLLFQMSFEAVLVLDAANQTIVEANAAAVKLLGHAPADYVGRRFPEGFDTASTETIETFLARARTLGRVDDIHVRLADRTANPGEFLMAASMFRQENYAYILVRLTQVQVTHQGQPVERNILDVVEQSNDGFVVATPDGRILSANHAFVELAQLSGEDQAHGQSLERWLGRSEVDYDVLMANLRQRGSVRLFATGLRGEDGAITDVEVSAVSVPHGDTPCLGFTIRNMGGRVMSPSVSNGMSPHMPLGASGNVLGFPSGANGGTPRSVEQLTELVGRVPLKELVGETTDLIEKLCIEAALKLTEDNRAAAAEMLGLSRQSLYVKLRRYGLGDLPLDGESEGD